jgi:hypothetical protein
MVLGCAAMFYLSRLHVDSGYAAGVLPGLIAMGLAMGMVMAPSMNTATAGVQPQDAGVAAALVSTMQQVGGSVGTAVLSTITATVTTNYLSSHHGPLVGPLAATHGYITAFAIASGLFAVGAIMCGLLFPSKARLAEMRAATGAAVAPDSEDDALSEIVAVEF